MSKLDKILIAGVIIFLIILGKFAFAPRAYQGSIPDPVQIDLISPDVVYVSGEDSDIKIDLLAEYTIEAVIKSKKKYSDYSSQVAKYDVALAWGDLNQNDIDEHIKYSQRGRWYYYTWDSDSSVNESYIAEHSANVHLINQDSSVLKEIKKLDVKDHIKLTGYLVSVNFENGP
ncbi:MAG: hypothetical protein JJE03_02525 [Peptostreptococcaceae bacterium]|nr:hypothetical protein [Peptostreptococcaceae bacterium]